MLRSIENLYRNPVIARDGEIGRVADVYFDDEAWGVRYLIVETGKWFGRKPVLISPYSFEPASPDSGTIKLGLTRKQVKDSPGIDTHKPVSRQHEIDYLGYYGYPAYWGGAYAWGMGAFPTFGSMDAAPDVERDESMRGLEDEEEYEECAGDTHLRSARAIKGYGIEAADGGIGHVHGFVFDDAAWVIRYLIVDTRNWWPGGREVLIATRWLNHIDWIGSTVSTALTRDEVRTSPPFSGTLPIDRSFEERLHKHYGQHEYWLPDGSEDSAVIEPVSER
jgi:sporulation protein YlmC with PRC-barrel domain